MTGTGPSVVATVTAVDSASPVLQKIAALARQLAKELNSNAGSAALASHLDLANARVREHVGIVDRLKSSYNAAAQAAKTLSLFAASKAAFAVEHGARSAIEHGAELQHREIELRTAGISTADIDAYKRQIAQLQLSTPGVSTEGALELAKELRSVLLKVEEVPHILPSVVKAKAAIEAGGGNAEGLGQLVKAGELLGYAQDPAKFERYIDAVVKAQQIAGKLINPENLFELAKYERSAGRNLSERFQTTTAVSLAQELGGSSTGKAIDQFVKTIVGATNNHAALKVAADYGLINRDDLIFTKTGEAHGLKAGKQYIGGDEAQRNPDEWVWKTLIPALEKHGDTTAEQQVAAVRKLFPAGTSSDLVNKLISQRESFENHARLYPQAAGLAAADLYQGDALTSLKNLSTVLHDFGATLAEPIMKDAAGVLSGITRAFAGLKEQYQGWAQTNPKDAERVAAMVPGAGLIGAAGGLYAGWKGVQSLFGVTALTGSATALDSSAAALTAAAAALEGAAGVQAGKAAIGAEAGAAAGSGLLGKLATAAGWAGIGYLGYRQWSNIKGADELPPENAAERFAARVDSWFASHWGGKAKPLDVTTARAVDEATRLHNEAKADLEAMRAKRAAHEASSHLAPANPVAVDPRRYEMPGSVLAVHPQKPQPVDVHGDVKGEVSILQKVDVNASPLLLATVNKAEKAVAIVTGVLSKLGPTAQPDSGIIPVTK